MNAITTIFYTISNALLVPTELALILSLLAACYAVGVALRETFARRAEADARTALETGLTEDAAFDVAKFLAERNAKLGLAMTVVKEVAEKADDEPFVEKKVSEFESRVKSRCERAERLVKIGPALGLMGTLIPLGPALLGLAQGDLNTLAANLVVAFSTTVVGLTTAIIASFVLAAQKRWARADFILVNFAVNRCAEQLAKRKENR
ncbi:MAG: MotA/TolQ/ExbB proton channel family protein [Thermoguttaceae bacterium]|nr:MotA/TolQ/ExbB proton channel family protein [Thermoguttaceae bacterium]